MKKYLLSAACLLAAASLSAKEYHPKIRNYHPIHD